MVSSRFSTACHHRAGTNTTSPGRWMNSTGWCSAGHCLACDRKRRHQRRNQHAADSPLQGGLGAGYSLSLGVHGGNMTQSFVPLIKAFQAEVPKGSLCKKLPDLEGPINNQRYGGRRVGPNDSRMSCANKSGAEYCSDKW
mmetsp:Transcript_85381/g.226677  ORF Transcript_85381/g.226677 Transcript_85381/m.226677 type:complete len:140 (+) Transcript_85381:349-768(+)